MYRRVTIAGPALDLVRKQWSKKRSRNIHALFQAKTAENAR
jgi:hypothetical protein